MFKQRRISDLLVQLDRIPVPETRLDALQQEVIAEITALWQTDDVRHLRPAVRDEIRMARLLRVFHLRHAARPLL